MAPKTIEPTGLCGFLYYLCADHTENTTWRDSSHITHETLNQNTHILERKRNDITKHVESLKTHKTSQEKAACGANQGLSVEGTALALNKKYTPQGLTHRALT